MDKVVVQSTEEFLKLSVGARMKLADSLGAETGKIINRAVRKANKMLEKFGFMVTVKIEFHETSDKKQE